jgi:hypothetical protein
MYSPGANVSVRSAPHRRNSCASLSGRSSGTRCQEGEFKEGETTEGETKGESVFFGRTGQCVFISDQRARLE